MQSRRFVLSRRPNGLPTAADFRLETAETPALAEGEFLIRNHYASLDPAIRGWLDDAPSYMPPVALGDPVRASTVGVVAESRAPDFPVGQWVLGLGAIEDYTVGRAGGFTQPIDPHAVPSVTHYLSIFGAVGMTAYFGVIDILKPRAGETLLVSGAAGAVGSLVGQIGKARGCRAIGIAGGPEKCARLTERYGFDAAIDYRGKDEAALAAAIAEAAPDGVHMVFENVGGVVLDAALLNLAHGARIALCGLISEYNTDPCGARNLWRVLTNRATITGFIVADYVPRFAEGAAAMGGWLADGKLVFDEHVDEGLDNALPAFLRLFEGSNQGKMILKIAP